ncbi:MAG: cytochrome c [Solirubrobacterales bacterium]|nr:cytochrome c [Solirubrobacterales bacterium]MBV9715211.1 cytochrome c [Solirubrobacterales bacterium]
MLGIVLFVAFWVLLALGVFFIAARGGLGGARQTLQTQTYRGRRAMAVGLVILYIAFGIAIPLIFLNGNHANASGQIGGITLTAADKEGRTLFGEKCALCHTLAAANAVGKVGPNLDMLRPPASLVLNTINNGCLPNPPPGQTAQACLGNGVMPSGILQGRQAQQVAAFVGKVAGRE